jgi:hypothetical protein
MYGGGFQSAPFRQLLAIARIKDWPRGCDDI